MSKICAYVVDWKPAEYRRDSRLVTFLSDTHASADMPQEFYVDQLYCIQGTPKLLHPKPPNQVRSAWVASGSVRNTRSLKLLKTQKLLSRPQDKNNSTTSDPESNYSPSVAKLTGKQVTINDLKICQLSQIDSTIEGSTDNETIFDKFLSQQSTPKHYLESSKPTDATISPDLAISNPDVANNSSDAANSNPDVANSNPDVVNSNPDVANSNPDVANPEVTNNSSDVFNINSDVANSNSHVVNSNLNVANVNLHVANNNLDVADISLDMVNSSSDVVKINSDKFNINSDVDNIISDAFNISPDVDNINSGVVNGNSIRKANVNSETKQDITVVELFPGVTSYILDASPKFQNNGIFSDKTENESKLKEQLLCSLKECPTEPKDPNDDMSLTWYKKVVERELELYLQKVHRKISEGSKQEGDALRQPPRSRHKSPNPLSFKTVDNIQTQEMTQTHRINRTARYVGYLLWKESTGKSRHRLDLQRSKHPGNLKLG